MQTAADLVIDVIDEIWVFVLNVEHEVLNGEWLNLALVAIPFATVGICLMKLGGASS